MKAFDCIREASFINSHTLEDLAARFRRQSRAAGFLGDVLFDGTGSVAEGTGCDEPGVLPGAAECGGGEGKG